MSSEVKQFDYLDLGGGSGGIASARRAAELGVSVALIEYARLGGTCVGFFFIPSVCPWQMTPIIGLRHRRQT